MESFREICGGDENWIYEMCPGEYVMATHSGVMSVSPEYVIDTLAGLVASLRRISGTNP